MKHLYVLVFALANASGFLYAHDLSVEELQQQLPSLDGREKAYALQELALHLGRDSFELALTYVEEAIMVGGTLQEADLQTEALLTKGNILWSYGRQLQDRQRAVNTYLEANRLAESHKLIPQQAQSALLAAKGYIQFEEYEEALFHLFRAAIQFEALGDHFSLIEAYLAIADIFQATQSIEQANQYSQMALELADEIGTDSLRAQIYYSLGAFNLSKGMDQSAASYLRESLRLARAFLPEEQHLLAMIKLGEAQTELGQTEEAEATLVQALSLAKAYQQPALIAESYFALAKKATLQEAFPQAIAYLDSSTELLVSQELAYALLDNYELYASLYLEVNDLQSMRYYLNQLQRKRDSLQVFRKQDMITKMETLYGTHQTDLRLKQKELDLAQKEARIKVIILVGVLLLMLVIFLIWKAYTRHKVNQELERQVAERTQELRALNEELDILAYRTAHDVRGPVARLLGLCQVALLDQGNQSATENILEMIRSEALAMDVMLHRFLEVNNIKHQKAPDSFLRVADLIDETLEELSELEGYSLIDIRKNIEPGLQVNTNASVFKILVKNLLENALRFYQKGETGPRYIRISSWRDSLGQLQLKIADNGMGIDPEVRPHIFKMFYRGTNASQGLGLGLYAAKMAAERLGATLTYESNNPEETEFRVSL